MTRRPFATAVALAVVVTACSPGSGDASAVPPLPETTPEAVATLLAASDQPVLLNIWASWCIPCRSEAPLLRQAHKEFGEDVRFIGVAVRDRQNGSRAFLDEFGLTDFDHYFNGSGDVPGSLGGRGVPITFFFRSGGELSHRQEGVIDERTLALHLDELTRG